MTATLLSSKPSLLAVAVVVLASYSKSGSLLGSSYCAAGFKQQTELPEGSSYAAGFNAYHVAE